MRVRGRIGVPELAARLGLPERSVRRWVQRWANLYPEHVEAVPSFLSRKRFRIDYQGLVDAVERGRAPDEPGAD